MKHEFHRASTSKLWEIVAFAVAELAQRNPAAPGSPRVEIRNINGESQATAMITVMFTDAELGGGYDGENIPPLVCIGNATLNKTNLHHFDSFPVSKKLVNAVNRNAYRENSRLTF